MTRSRLVLALIAVIVGSTVFGGVAAAVGTAKADKLAACTSHKHVRILGKKVKCHAGEKRLAWRVKGEPGPTGPAGPMGKIGNVRTVFVTGPTMNNPSAGAVTTAGFLVVFLWLGEIPTRGHSGFPRGWLVPVTTLSSGVKCKESTTRM